MSYGLGISFGRLCRRERTLDPLGRYDNSWYCKFGIYEFDPTKGTVKFISTNAELEDPWDEGWKKIVDKLLALGW